MLKLAVPVEKVVVPAGKTTVLPTSVIVSPAASPKVTLPANVMPPLNVRFPPMAVELANVQVAALTVTVSTAAFPRVVFPVLEKDVQVTPVNAYVVANSPQTVPDHFCQRFSVVSHFTDPVGGEVIVPVENCTAQSTSRAVVSDR